MASPPYSANSPPGPSPLALPRQRPTLALPHGATKSRKPSIASTTSSAHPLRQTSFPPAESLEAQHAAAQFSPTEGGFEDDFSDSEIVSAISGPSSAVQDGTTGKKRKRGGGKMGRPKKKRGSESVVNGDDGTPGRGGKRGQDADAEDEDEDQGDEETDARGGRVPAFEGAQMTEEEIKQDEKNRHMLVAHLKALDAAPLTDHGRQGITRKDLEERYNLSKSVKLRTADVKKLVNQTVSQSVPPPVVLAVQAYTKLFAGMLVEGAREVQREWMAVEGERADGGENKAWKRLRRSYGESGKFDEVEVVDGAEGAEQAEETVVKNEVESPATRPNSSGAGASQANGTAGAGDGAGANGTQSSTTVKGDESEASPLYPGGASALQTSIEECDRGPLLPDHLREALRRYKKSHRGGAVGFTGYSLEGKTGTAARMGGRRLFR